MRETSITATRGLTRLRRHPVITSVVVVAVLLVAYAVTVTVLLLGARTSLEEGRDTLTGALDVLEDREARTTAREQIAVAHRHFDQGADRLTSPVLAPLRAVPLVGANLRAAATAATVTRDITEDLTGVLAVVFDGESDDLARFAPRGGRIPVEELTALVEPLTQVHTRAEVAVDRVARAAEGPLLPQVETAVLELLAEVKRLEHATGVGVATLAALPDLLGAEEPRRYFFGAGNPAELRGIGGFLGAYAILEIHDGRVAFGEFAPIQALRDLPVGAVAAPNPDFAARYDQYGGTGFWQNINMTPDFPSAAQAILALYERTEGERLDGVIAADPIALQALATVTGPVEIPGIGRIAPGDIAATIANEAFGEFHDNVLRKRVLGAVAASVFTGLLDGGAGDPVAAATALATAARNGNVLLHSADADVQERLVQAGLAGALYRGDDDFFQVVGANGAGNKVDFYMDRTVTYDVALEPGGRVDASAGVELRNHTPTQGEPKHVIGPNYFDFAPGENATILNVFCGRCAIHRFTRDGAPTPVRAEEELGHRVFWSYERLRSGESVQLGYDWVLDDGWQQGRRLGRYRLVVDGQVTMRPTRFALRVLPPAGMDVVSTSPAMTADGDALTWEGELSGRRVFEVVFRPAGNPVRRAFGDWWRDPVRGD